MAKSIKQKKCRICKEKFTPFQFAQVVCTNNGYACAREYAHQQREKQVKKEKKEFNAETRRMKEKIKSKSQWAKEAQAAFNRYIRLRDSEKGCVCCNNKKYDGQYHAGHYLSVGAHPELRFEEDNCHKQKSSCNNYKSGNQIPYRKYLIKKIGLERVEWLEGPHEAKHYTIDDLKEIKATYSAKTRELEKEINIK